MRKRIAVSDEKQIVLIFIQLTWNKYAIFLLNKPMIPMNKNILLIGT